MYTPIYLKKERKKNPSIHQWISMIIVSSLKTLWKCIVHCYSWVSADARNFPCNWTKTLSPHFVYYITISVCYWMAFIQTLTHNKNNKEKPSPRFFLEMREHVLQTDKSHTSLWTEQHTCFPDIVVHPKYMHQNQHSLG